MVLSVVPEVSLHPSQVAHSTVFPPSHYLTPIRNEFYCPCSFFWLSCGYSSTLQPLFAFLCCLEEKENLFYSTLCFIPLWFLAFLLVEKCRSRINFWRLFYGPWIFLKERHTSAPLWKPHSTLAYRWCLLSWSEAHFCSIYCPCVHFRRPPVRLCERAEGIKRSLKITKPSVATPPQKSTAAVPFCLSATRYLFYLMWVYLINNKKSRVMNGERSWYVSKV